MGARVVSQGRVQGPATSPVKTLWGPTAQGSVMGGKPVHSAIPLVEVHYDGGSSTKGTPKGLHATPNVAIVDMASLMKNGVNLGATIRFSGSAGGSASIEACTLPRELYARLQSDDQEESEAALEVINSRMTIIGEANNTAGCETETSVFTLLKVTFTEGGPGTVILTAR